MGFVKICLNNNILRSIITYEVNKNVFLHFSICANKYYYMHIMMMSHMCFEIIYKTHFDSY